MAQRPVFLSISKPPYFKACDTFFEWHAGMSLSQKQKCIKSLHEAFLKIFKDRKVLEISSKSLQDEGVKASAFNLEKFVPSLNRKVPVECVYQGGKVFSRGGPFVDIYEKSTLEAKQDSRLKESGHVVGFYYEGETFATLPKNAFYDWLYINALMENENLANEILKYNAFTDIVFNPEKSINCQARAAAIFVSLHGLGLLEKCKNYSEFVKLFV